MVKIKNLRIMKKSLLPALLFLIFNSATAQVGIGTSTPNSSSILDVNVNNLPANGKKGFLMPQVALTGTNDLTTIPNPTNGLIVYNTANAGTSPNNVVKDNVYKFLSANNAWMLMLDQNALANLSIPTVGAVLGFNKTGNDTTYLGADQGGTIRQLLFDNIRLQNAAICTYNTTTNEFTANKTGYYNFQVNLVILGPYTGNARLGVSKPYTGSASTALGQGNAFVGFFSQNYYNVGASNVPVTLSTNGLQLLTAGQKVMFLTRYIDPTSNSLNVESANYDRTLVNSVSVTYFSN